MYYLFIITFLRIDWGTVFLIFCNYFAINLPSSYLIFAFMMQFPHQKATFLCKNTKKKLKNRNYRDKYD